MSSETNKINSETNEINGETNKINRNEKRSSKPSSQPRTLEGIRPSGRKGGNLEPVPSFHHALDALSIPMELPFTPYPSTCSALPPPRYFLLMASRWTHTALWYTPEGGLPECHPPPRSAYAAPKTECLAGFHHQPRKASSHHHTLTTTRHHPQHRPLTSDHHDTNYNTWKPGSGTATPGKRTKPRRWTVTPDNRTRPRHRTTSRTSQNHGTGPRKRTTIPKNWTKPWTRRRPQKKRQKHNIKLRH